MKKVTIIGAGNVGASAAQEIASHGIAHVVLFDIVEGMPQGKALDIQEACPLWGSSSSVTGTNDYALMDASDIVVVTAGIARKPGMSRDDLLLINAGIVESAAREMKNRCPEAVVIVVTNPMDAMAHLVWKATGFPDRHVMGMGGVLDAARLRAFAAMELGVSARAVDALVLGGHGDQMVPMPRFTTVRGVPLTELLPAGRIDALMDRTRKGGAEIVGLLKSGSAYYAPAAAIYEMVRTIVLDEKNLLPAACLLKGQYGVTGLFVGVPAILGAGGVEKIIELPLNEREQKDFQNSVDAVSGLVRTLKL